MNRIEYRIVPRQQLDVQYDGKMAAWILAICRALVVACVLLSAADLSAQDTANDDAPRYFPGLIATYTDGQGRSYRCIDERVSFDWRDAPPDARVAEGKFSAHWRGRLRTTRPGSYRLSAYVTGEVQLTLNGRVVLDASAKKPSWINSRPIELPFGHHPLRISYRKTSETARLSLLWSGPGFSLEPLSERWLFHEPKDSPDDQFKRGRLLADAHRCAACHKIPSHATLPKAPALDRVAGNLSRRWIVDRLTASKPAAGKPHGTMPRFKLKKDNAEAIAAYLFSEPARQPEKKKTPQGDAESGKILAHTLGCLACHTIDKLGQRNLFGGGDLAHVGQKRPADFFARWLADPAAINRDHRMPVYDLTAVERGDLTAYLATLAAEGKPAVDTQPRQSDTPLVARGRKLVRQHRCAACHRLGNEKLSNDLLPRPIDTSDAAWKQSCVGPPRDGRPGYHLPQTEAEAIRKYLIGLSQAKVADKAIEPDAALLMARNNCLSCHARGLQGGIADRLPAVAERHGVLASLLPAMAPPALDGVGDKLTRKSLAKAIRRDGPPLRDWLVVRMPKFRLSDKQLGSIADHLIATDRVFDRPSVEAKLPARKQLLSAGAKLVTSQGFGCASCHGIGRRQPSKDSLAARGPNLSMLGERIRRTWFDRFVRNPSRIVPRMEMPTIAIAARGHLGENLDHQLAAVWEVLNQQGFEPPASSAVRIARTAAIPGRSRRAIVLTDVLHTPGRQYVKPLLIGLPNRHNVLFDLETSRLAGWWTGDAAAQRTKGKSWFWEAAGESVASLGGDGPELGLGPVEKGAGEKLLRPLQQGQYISEFDSVEHLPGGLRFRQRLHFSPKRVVSIEQTFTSQWRHATASGFARSVRITGLKSNEPVHLRVVASEQFSKSNISKDARRITLPGGEASILLSGAKTARFVFMKGAIHATQGARRTDGSVEFKLLYLTERPVPPFAIESIVRRANKPVELTVVPGYRATRLSLPEEMMPTGLAWRPDGTLVISSLKGRVWLAHDRDGDGLEDHAAPFSDELAAPYGVATRGEAIDVVTKSALLRLFDDNHDGRADRTVTLASGWGHTADYHDWTVGLISDPAGNYYVALPCQQDKRTGAAAYLRGTVLKLAPRTPDRRDPRPFAIEPLSAGHRFPMGLARNRRGDLFVTDNQGNWNPFNELNHVVAKAHYGFINANDRNKNLKRPTRPAAIEIPHPWTRSVNGICFLDTPAAVRRQLGRDLFGPLEGHLIGCEYDTRRLVRMSLQRVGETYQGACYPFSVDPLKDKPALLGPIICAVAPDGDLYVGCIRDSGWGGGQNIGTVVRLRPTGELPCGIAEVRANSEGFIIDLTAPADARRMANLSSYSISSYRRQTTPVYGGKDQDRRSETIESVTVSKDRRQIKLRLRSLRAGFVYDLRLKNLAGEDKTFFPAEAYYTLRTIPK